MSPQIESFEQLRLMAEKAGRISDEAAYVSGPGGKAAERHRRLTISVMLKRWGRLFPPKTCGECSHLLTNHVHNLDYFKCGLFKDSGSSATDWRKCWPSCRRFDPMGESVEKL